MLFTLAALAADAPTEALPSLRNSASHLELRVGTAAYQALTRVPSAENPAAWSPNAHVTATAGKGASWIRAEFAMHAALALTPWGAQGRVEPRVGVRFAAPWAFGGFGAGLSMDGAGVMPMGLASLGWLGKGARVRPLIAVEGRLPVGLRHDIQIRPVCMPNGPCPAGDRESPGGAGILVSAGLNWTRYAAGVATP